MNHFETLPGCGLSSGTLVTEVPSEKVADMVAGPAVPVRLNCHVWVPPGGGGWPSNSPQVPLFVPWPVKVIVSAAAVPTKPNVARAAPKSPAIANRPSIQRGARVSFWLSISITSPF
jgi:hypothetical protein